MAKKNEYRIEGPGQNMFGAFSLTRPTKSAAMSYAKSLVERDKQPWVNIFWREGSTTRGISFSKGKNGKVIKNRFTF